ncbi:Uncharacterised protein [Mycobacterium tuberculosis]|nr:Uncharacterised protein [Mycobacterium tuberculosis]
MVMKKNKFQLSITEKLNMEKSLVVFAKEKWRMYQLEIENHTLELSIAKLTHVSILGMKLRRLLNQAPRYSK